MLIEDFPATSEALAEPNGLLAIGGDLSSARLLLAYSRGIFPWFEADQPVMWWSPAPRTVLEPTNFHLNRSLRKTLRNRGFQLGCNANFEATMRACAAPRRDSSGTWISEDMVSAYTTLHRLGFAHSIEVQLEGQTVGGLYGVSLGRMFFGESMFSRVPDASKVALAALVWLARQGAFTLIDCQMANPHLTRMGAVDIPRQVFENLLTDAITDDMIWINTLLSGNDSQCDISGRPEPQWIGLLPDRASALLGDKGL